MFQFPASPIVGQLFNPAPGVTFRWNGTAWFLIAGPGAFISQAEADLRYLQLANLPHRNVIIGGDFGTNPWQRGTNFPAAAHTSYQADRFSFGNATDGVVTISKSADGPSVAQCGRLVTHCLLVDVTTADASIAAAQQSAIIQSIEGYNFLPLAQRPCVLSFWHRHTKTGTYCVGFTNAAADRCFVAEYSQSVSDVWERAEIPVPASPAAGTWNYTNGAGCALRFVIACGTDYQQAAGAWQVTTSVKMATANQVNAFDNVANNFRIALVQLEAGSIATPFDGAPVDEVLLHCLRYFQRYGTGNTNDALMNGYMSTTTRARGILSYPRMRGTPAITVSAASDWFVNHQGFNDPATGFGTVAITQTVDKCMLEWDIATPRTAGTSVVIYGANINARLNLSAEF